MGSDKNSQNWQWLSLREWSLLLKLMVQWQMGNSNIFYKVFADLITQWITIGLQHLTSSQVL